MENENKTPDKCCEKCRHDVDTCKRRPCNIANGYDLFESIIEGSEEDDTCPECSIWATVTDFTFCPKCGRVLD